LARFVTAEPLVAIVIPAYRQPEYLGQSIVSALRQTFGERLRVVIVNDGCPYATTDEVARFYASQDRRVRYLKTPNRGLSAARNAGIRYALHAWPTVEAIFPLDADNMLMPGTIESLYATLGGAAPSTGWVYQDMQWFGVERHLIATPREFSVYRLLLGNYCDAGSLVTRRVFEADHWFDESFRHGYEDWDFFIGAALKGFTGVHSDATGFLYRRRGHSMLSATAFGPAEAQVAAKHAEALHPSRLAALEHVEMPRYAFVDSEDGSVHYGTYASGPMSPVRTLNDLAGDIAAVWGAGPVASRYVPPLVLCAPGTIREALERERAWEGAVLRLQQDVAATGTAGIAVRPAPGPGIEWSPSLPAAASILMTPSRAVFEAAAHPGEFGRQSLEASTTVAISLQLAHLPGAGPSEVLSHLVGLVAGRLPGPETPDDARDVPVLGASNTQRAEELHVRPTATFYAPRPTVPGARTVMAVCRSDAAQRAAGDLGVLGRQLYGHGPLSLHLLVLGSAVHVDLSDTAVNSLVIEPEVPEAEAAVLQALAPADDILMIDYDPGDALLHRLARARARRLVLVSTAEDFALSDHPARLLAEAARLRETRFDAFMVASRRMVRMLQNWGVPAEKVAVCPRDPCPAELMVSAAPGQTP
jgi:hypothetical protein